MAAALPAGTAGTALARDAVTGSPPAAVTIPPDICDDLAVAGSYLDPTPPRGYTPPGWVWHDDPLGVGLPLPPDWTRGPHRGRPHTGSHIVVPGLTGLLGADDHGHMHRQGLLLTARLAIDLARCASARCPR